MTYYSLYFPYIVLSVLLAGLYFLLEKYLTKPWMRWVWWIGSVSILVVVGWYVGQNHILPDFSKGYYYGGRKILHNPGRLYDADCYGFTNFPLLAYLFAPFSLLPKREASLIFFIIEYVAILPLAYWLIKFANLHGWKRWLMLTLLALNGPLDYSIRLGNTTHFIMLSMLISFWWFKHGREWLTGIFLGINGLIKLPLILPAGYFFIRRRWRVVGGGILVVGLVLGFSLLLVPFSLNNMWLNNCVISLSSKPIAAYNNQSVIGFLARALIPASEGSQWIPLIATPDFLWISKIALFVLYIPAGIIVGYDWKSSRTSFEYVLEFSIVLAGSLLTSPISWTHYFMLFLMPVALYWGEETLSSRKVLPNLLLGISLVLLSSPVGLSLALFKQTHAQWMLSPHFIGGILFYVFLFVVWIHERYPGQQRGSPSQ